MIKLYSGVNILLASFQCNFRRTRIIERERRKNLPERMEERKGGGHECEAEERN
jgi:hypothetical protein